MAKTTKDGAEPRVVALAQQLGTVLGRAQARADELAVQVKKSTAKVKKSAAKAVAAVKPKLKAAKKKAAPVKVKARSGGTVDAPGKKHRKPPPQQKVDSHSSKPGSPMGQQGAKGRMQRGRG